jgi:hypothetical protein
VIIITPDISMDWWDSLIWLKAKGLIPTLLVFDPISYGAEGSSEIVLKQLVKANIQAYAIKSEMFKEHTEVKEEPLWEWRISGTGRAIPIKKPEDLSWKRLE